MEKFIYCLTKAEATWSTNVALVRFSLGLLYSICVCLMIFKQEYIYMRC